MANWWISLLVFASLAGINRGLETRTLQLENAPLFDFGIHKGHDIPDNFNNIRAIDLKFNISFFGASFKSLYINKDGFISFKENVKYIDRIVWAQGIRNIKADFPFIAPFYYEGYDPSSLSPGSYHGKIFHHVMYSDAEEPTDEDSKAQYYEEKKIRDYLTYYTKEAVINAPEDFEAKVVVIVTWSDVSENVQGVDCTKSAECESATFQAAIVADEKNTYVIFNYLKMGITKKPFYQAGVNGGAERGWLGALSCEGTCRFTDLDISNTSILNEMPNLLGSDMKGRFIYDVGREDVSRAGCLPPNLEGAKLEVYPSKVRMFGGEKLQTSGRCLPATSKFFCKFGDSETTTGEMVNSMRGYCPVPKMTLVGSSVVSWSSDESDWGIQRKLSVVGPWSLNDLERQDSASHVKAWFSKDAPSISFKWDPKLMSNNVNARVNVKLIGYRETSSKVEFRELENLGQTLNSKGSFTFKTESFPCTKNCKDFHVGLLEVSLEKAFYAEAKSRVAIRFGPMPLGWYINNEMTEREGSDWPEKMCQTWHRADSRDTSWRKDLPKCPCNLDQAIADFGRWQAHPDCDVYSGSKCVLYQGAKHCVRSMYTTRSGAGNECCYFKDGALMYRQLTFTAGGPSKKNIWGSAPYSRPGKVPVLSSAESDIIPYIHCCFWSDEDSDMCHQFTELRPTTGCDKYEVPGLAMVRGNTHITTFDGSTYTFEAIGDFWLLKHPSLSIQGRFDSGPESFDLGRLAGRTSSKVPTLTHVNIKAPGGQTIRLHPAPMGHGLDIKVGTYKYFFLDETTMWQEFDDAIIINNAKSVKENHHNNITIIIGEIGINVVAINNLLHLMVVLPPSMKDPKTGKGLLGAFDGTHDNDYISRSGIIKSSGIDPETLYKMFSYTWAVKKEESLFTLPKNVDDFPDHTQYFKYANLPHGFATSPTDAQISSVCGDDDNCKWDYRATGNVEVAKETKEADEFFSYLQGSAYKVENCGLPAIGDMAILNAYNFSAGRDIAVTGCSGNHNFEGRKEFKCVMERMSVAEEKKRDDYGRKVTFNQADYLVHWVPEPSTVCSEDSSSSSASMGMIIGIAVGVVVVIILIIVIVVVVKKKRRGNSKDMKTPRGTDRVRKDQDFEEGTDEPMMSDSRKPVYKPSKQESARSSSAV